MSRYRVPATQPDFTFDLIGSGFTDDEGNPTNASDIDLSVESTNTTAVVGTLGAQTLSEDGKTVTAPLNVHVESPSVDLGVLVYKATNRVTGKVVAGDSDEFIVGPGGASMGTITSEVPLTAEPEPEPAQPA